MEYTVTAPSRARGYQSEGMRQIEQADPETVRLDARPPLPPRAIGPPSPWLATGIFSARAAQTRDLRASTAFLWLAAKEAPGLCETSRSAFGRPRPRPRGETPRLSTRRAHLDPSSPLSRRRLRPRRRARASRRPGR